MSTSTGKLTYAIEEMNPSQRLRELILHIASASSKDAKFGKTKLVKLLYLIDFSAFRDTGQPITGYPYVKLPNGPFPDHLDVLLDDMRQQGDIDIEDDPFAGYLHSQFRVVAKRPAKLGPFFTPEDIAFVDAFILAYRDYSGSDLAKMTHGIAWKIPDIGEGIPYEASLQTDEEITQEDIDHVERLIAEYGLEPDEE